jgi:phenylalanyl-tRNA synthetase alpha chain
MNRKDVIALHDIEYKILMAFYDYDMISKATLYYNTLSLEDLVNRTLLNIDQVRRGIEWLKYKGLVKVEESERKIVTLGDAGKRAVNDGLPEEILNNTLKNLKDVLEIKELRRMIRLDEKEFNAAIKHAKEKGIIRIENGKLIYIGEWYSREKDYEYKLLKRIHDSNGLFKEELDEKELKVLEYLIKRPGYIVEKSVKQVFVSLTEKGIELVKQIQSGAIIRTLDVTARAPIIYAGRKHILQEVIDEVREILIGMGFEEIDGSIVQYSFWNFDALFTPQDHPAREMQDTFYIDIDTGKKASSSNNNSNSNDGIASDELIARVSDIHEASWRYRWSMDEAKRLVLRTHTTAVTIRYLAEHRPKEASVFSIGRVFRNEKVNYKHLAEFHQIEGIVVSDDVTLRDLMGIQQEFYRRLGLSKVKFWPTYFPYTEPSLQSMVYHERLGRWVELFGMGIFRPEVTEPIGVKSRVLAWGGGLERIAMLKYGIDDVRELYSNRLSILRGTPLCQL